MTLSNILADAAAPAAGVEAAHGAEAAQNKTKSAVDAVPQKHKRKTRAAAPPVEPGKTIAPSAAPTKSELVRKKLRSAKGATLEQLMEATGWQAHSVRGFLSGTVKKKLGLTVASEVGKDGLRRYRVVADPAE